MSSLAGGAARPPLEKAPCSTYAPPVERGLALRLGELAVELLHERERARWQLAVR
jgi:hypothetical protein